MTSGRSDFYPPRMIAVYRSGGGALAWIRPAGEGRQWLITGHLHTVRVASALIAARCRENSGRTDWEWIRSEFDNQLRARGYRLANLAVRCAEAKHFDADALGQRKVNPGEAIALVDGGQMRLFAGHGGTGAGMGLSD